MPVQEWKIDAISRLVLCDCIEFMKSLQNDSIDFVFCDPPYGHNNNDGDLIANREKALGVNPKDGGKSRPIANDGVEANDLFKKFLKETSRILKPGSCCCSCCDGGGPDPQFARWALWMSEYYDFKQMVIWDKGKMGMGWHYRRSYETILVGMKKGAACAWYDTTKKVENIIRPNDYGIRKIIPSASQHPTEKPVELAAHFIRLHSKPGDTVLDPFAGSGSTGVAALLCDRHFIGCEIDPEWFNYAKHRMKNCVELPSLF